MTTLNLQVGASTDDADEATDGTMDLTSVNVFLIVATNWAGLALNDVTVPQGATVDTGTLQISIPSTDYDDVYVDVYGEDEDDPGTFTSDNGDISGRTPTTAKKSVSASGVGTGWYSITVTDPVQEIVNRGGFASGNDLVLIMDAQTSINLRFKAYDGDSGLAAKLDIDYTAAAGIAGPLVNRIPLGSLVHGGLAG